MATHRMVAGRWWCTITSKGAQSFGFQGACALHTTFGRAVVRDGVAPPAKGVRACNVTKNLLKICF